MRVEILYGFTAFATASRKLRALLRRNTVFTPKYHIIDVELLTIYRRFAEKMVRNGAGRVIG
jgi:hypothetical protein